MTKTVRFVGDIHGDLNSYFNIVDDVPHSVQVGDFGLGFIGLNAVDIDVLLEHGEKDHRFIRGNHDDPAECAKSTHWIPDGTVEGDVMYIGGAVSIDKHLRTPGLNWWPDEELSIPRLSDMVALYEKHTPRVLITHDCSEFFARQAMIPLVNGFTNIPSNTRDALDVMYSIKPPEIHIFGHWHKNVDYFSKEIGTRFICLGINAYTDLEV